MNQFIIVLIRVLFVLAPVLWIIWTISAFRKNKIKLFKFQIIFPLTFILFLILVVLIVRHSYPDSWKNIEVGQTRQIILENIGKPSWDQWDIKGDFWEDRNPSIDYSLNVWYDNDTLVKGYMIKFYIGAIENNHSMSIKLVH